MTYAPPRPASRPSAPAAPARIEALDLVRLLAVVGMMSAHLLAPLALVPGASGPEAAAAEVAHLLTEGTSSTLFAVVGGCSLVLASRQRLADGDRRGAVLALLVRGGAVTLLGLLLELVPSPVMVVLVPFGLSMMITAPLLLLRTRVLVAVIGVLTVVGHPLAMAVPGRVEFGTVTLLSLDDPVGVLRGLVLTGQYPLVTWIPYLLTGIVLMRAVLRAQEAGRIRRLSLLALIGATVTAAVAHLLPVAASAVGHASPGAWYTAATHTGTVADMLASGGIAVALISAALCLLPPMQLLPSLRTVRGRIAQSLRAAGAAPLTIYVAHVLATGIALVTAALLAGGDLSSMPWYIGGVGILAVHLAGVLVLGAVLAARGGRGPLEALLATVIRRAVRR
ncbi:MAG: heparan-alpha-glucosaminide N-acetyltransferase domain-containing protein [Brachybacterium sp.]|uniref:heparan-alpha-glucosaminide N-acetyltransferase domain-containing protein n=1 Tax=Brachybacterium sp. TaxID=1891286 RepID=UPI00264A0A45|nr:heparan-alpha-glucosaminide N-acetyltransferase domain-containing protein [Brachybacterium sp.]MDN5687159.1 heparan-alpha-glucosaminide N-acetyltransferase domain-containing protein [Brachybacterium sp.]